MALFEVKNPNRPPSAQRLTHDEEMFFERHQDCEMHVVTTAVEILFTMTHGICPTSAELACTCLEAYRRKPKKDGKRSRGRKIDV